MFKEIEYRILLYAFIGTLLFLSLFNYYQDLFPNHIPKFYTSFHTIVEFFSITISITIFTYGWKAFSFSQSRRTLLLSFVFLTIGLLDLLHTLSFTDMPFFITEALLHNSIWFWLISRLTAAITVFVILLLPDKRLNHDPRFFLLSGTSVYVLLISFFIFNYGGSLPEVVIENQGTTGLKKGIEFFISFFYLAIIVISILDYKKNKKTSSLYILLSFYFLLISELILASYSSEHDFNNFTGHLFKVLGYFFILKGFYFSAISEDKLAEEKVRLARQELNDILREQQGIIFKFQKSKDGFIYSLSTGELLNKLSHQLHVERKKTLEEYLPAYREFLFYHYNLAWDSGQKTTFEIDAGQVCLYVTLNPIIRDGTVKEIIGTVTDITQLKNMEEIVQSSEKLSVLGELAAGIAHEVRNPLTTLKGFLQLISSDIQNDKQKYIRLMLDEVDRIEVITNEFMNAAKPQKLHYNEINIDSIIQQVIALMQPQAVLNGIQINLNETGNLPPVFGEKNHLKQVFINFTKNAFEAMSNGGTLTIKIEQTHKEHIHIYFIDTGHGIPEDALKKLGEPFFTLKESGNGLGLMMCKKIIQAHKGILDVKSELNKGTTFKITLPVYQGNKDEQ